MNLSDNTIQKIISNMLLMAQMMERSIMIQIGSDIWIDSNMNTHLIECSCFGTHSSTDSSLFHWKRDMKLLYDDDGITYVSYDVPYKSLKEFYIYCLIYNKIE